MTIIGLSILALLVLSLMINNLFPVISRGRRGYHLVPVTLLTSVFLSGFVSQILTGNPEFSHYISLKWLMLSDINLDFGFNVNNATLLLGSLLGIFFSIQFILTVFSGNSGGESAISDQTFVHRVNGLYLLTIISFIILLSDSLLILFVGMIGLSGIVLYQIVFSDTYQSNTKSILTFISADFIIFLVLLITIRQYHTLNISALLTITGGLTREWIGPLMVGSFVIKLIGFLYTFNSHSHTGGTGLFDIGVTSLYMILMINISGILSEHCLTGILILGILITLYSSFLSISTKSSQSAFRHFLISQYGLFLVIIGSRLPFYSMIFVVGFTTANLLFILIDKNVQRMQKTGVPVLKSVHTWHFLFAALCVVGFLPATGFIPRFFLVLRYINKIQFGILFWVVLILLALSIMIFSLGVFRYFFYRFNRWKSQPISDSGIHPAPSIIIGLLLIVNTYVIYTIPKVNPVTTNTWFTRIIPQTLVLSAVNPMSVAISWSVVLAGMLTGIVIALLTYQFQVIRESVIIAIVTPVQKSAALGNKLLTSLFEKAVKIVNNPARWIRYGEEYLSRKMVNSFNHYLNSFALTFTSLKQKITYQHSFKQITERISTLALRFAEKYEMLIPGILIIVILIILILSIL